MLEQTSHTTPETILMTMPTHPALYKIDEAKEYLTDEACYILELSNTPEDPQVSITRARVDSGVTTRWHRLKGITERYVILAGQGRVYVGAELTSLVVPGDVVVIPPNQPQRITNIGSSDLIFLAVCSPRFIQDAYEDIEAEMQTNF